MARVTQQQVQSSKEQVRDKNSNVTQTTSRFIGVKREKRADELWLCLKEMTDKYGSARVNHWFAHKALKRRPDPLTGSLEDEICEFMIPQFSESIIATDSQATGVGEL